MFKLNFERQNIVNATGNSMRMARRFSAAKRAIAAGTTLVCLLSASTITTSYSQTAAGKQLEEIETKLLQSKTRKEDLEKQTKILLGAIALLRETLVATASRIQTREAQANFIEERLHKLKTQEGALRKKFAARRDVLAELLGGLQRLEQNPPPALAVKPEDALSALRGAMLLGTIVPKIRNEANGLARSLAKMTALRRTIIAEQNALAANLSKLEKERLTARALLLKKHEASQITEAEVEAERLSAGLLAKEAKSLEDLIAKIGPGAKVNVSEFKASEKKAVALRNALKRQAALLKPTKAFSKTRGSLNFPAQGVRLLDFGKKDKGGTIAKGVSIATRLSAQITTPIDGRIVYAGRFRSYGHLLIISAGEGYHIVLAGMERISVSVGQFVLAGEPIGIMSNTTLQTSFANNIESDGKPVLYVEFRKDGISIDPRPWWAGGEKRARG